MDTIWELTFQLLSSISVQCNPVRERGLSGLTVNDIDMIQRIIQAELDRATDATCLRFESLCLTVIPGLLHLLGLLQNVPSDRLLLVVVVSESWLVLVCFYSFCCYHAVFSTLCFKTMLKVKSDSQ